MKEFRTIAQVKVLDRNDDYLLIQNGKYINKVPIQDVNGWGLIKNMVVDVELLVRYQPGSKPEVRILRKITEQEKIQMEISRIKPRIIKFLYEKDFQFLKKIHRKYKSSLSNEEKHFVHLLRDYSYYAKEKLGWWQVEYANNDYDDDDPRNTFRADINFEGILKFMKNEKINNPQLLNDLENYVKEERKKQLPWMRRMAKNLLIKLFNKATEYIQKHNNLKSQAIHFSDNELDYIIFEGKQEKIIVDWKNNYVYLSLAEALFRTSLDDVLKRYINAYRNLHSFTYIEDNELINDDEKMNSFRTVLDETEEKLYELIRISA